MTDAVFAHPCPHDRETWQTDDCMQCGCEVEYCPACPFFPCPACTRILLRPMPGEETYPFFPAGHLTPRQCWEIWTSYDRCHAEDIARSARLPLATQERLWLFRVRGIALWWHQFGFSVTHVRDLFEFLSLVSSTRQTAPDPNT